MPARGRQRAQVQYIIDLAIEVAPKKLINLGDELRHECIWTDWTMPLKDSAIAFSNYDTYQPIALALRRGSAPP